jgi:hypothetical protein
VKTKAVTYSFLIIAMMFMVVVKCYGQSDSLSSFNGHKPGIRDHIYLGGSFGLQIGTITVVELSPLVMYRITPRLFSGTGLTYIYYNDTQIQPKYSSNIYGGRILLNYTVIWNIFLHAEYELLNYQPYSFYPADAKRVNVNSWLVGAGFRQWIGSKSFLNLSVLWNLNETPLSPYTNPIIRIGVGFGL